MHIDAFFPFIEDNIKNLYEYISTICILKHI